MVHGTASSRDVLARKKTLKSVGMLPTGCGRYPIAQAVLRAMAESQGGGDHTCLPHPKRSPSERRAR